MDNIDIKILSCLRENARMNASDIGAHINMSVSSVIERIKKLEIAGIIKQYTIVLDPKQIGKDVFAFISVSLEHPKFNDSFSTSVQKIEQITECHYITGDFDFFLKVVAGSTQELANILNEIKSIIGVSLTRTLVVFSTIKNNVCVPPDARF